MIHYELSGDLQYLGRFKPWPNWCGHLRIQVRPTMETFAEIHTLFWAKQCQF